MRSASLSTWQNTPTTWIESNDAGEGATRGSARSRESTMSDAATKPKPAPAPAGVEAQQELTDGFHLVIDALKLNGITTIYGVPGIPITDLGRMAQAAGI